jgi:hypothetical protein
MPIRASMRQLYPDNWRAISTTVRFDREHGICQQCGRRHGETVLRLPDGRWFDSAINEWRGDDGQTKPWPDMFTYASAKRTRVYLAAAHITHDPRQNGSSPYPLVAAWCQRCHLQHDRPYHTVRRAVDRWSRQATADLFLGDYSNPLMALDVFTAKG